MSSSIAYSIGTSLRGGLGKKGIPGPGSYEPKADQVQETSPMWSMRGRSGSDFYQNENPGPGTYDYVYTQQSQQFNSPAWGMGYKAGDTQSSFTKLQLPGPGAYDPKTSHVYENSPKYSMAPRRDQSQKSNSPGPGNYEVNTSTMVGGPSTIMSQSPRDSKENLQKAVPGPGSYLPIKYKADSPMFGFGSASKASLDLSPSQIGPGSYQLGSTINKGGFSMGAKWRQDSQGSLSPGPGNYDLNLSGILQKEPNYGFGKGLRSQSVNKSYAPGPGAYKPQFSMVRESSPRVKFGQLPRLSLGFPNGVPGPGNYDINSSRLYEGPQFSMTPRREDLSYQKEQQSQPAPNQYNVQNNLIYENLGRCIIGTSQRESVGQSITPAPGTYYNTPKRYGGFTFGQQLRNGKFENGVPGPGAYQLKTLIGDVNDYIAKAGVPHRAGPLPEE